MYDCDSLVSVDAALRTGDAEISLPSCYFYYDSSLGPGRNMESEMEPWKIVNFSRGVPRHLSRGETEIHFRAVANDES